RLECPSSSSLNATLWGTEEWDILRCDPGGRRSRGTDDKMKETLIMPKQKLPCLQTTIFGWVHGRLFGLGRGSGWSNVEKVETRFGIREIRFVPIAPDLALMEFGTVSMLDRSLAVTSECSKRGSEAEKRVHKELAAGRLRGFNRSDSSGRFTIGPCRNAVGPHASTLFQINKTRAAAALTYANGPSAIQQIIKLRYSFLYKACRREV
ncbi:hypothetical protein PO909_020860, partial [Leuciscus waleckii]